MLDSWRLLSTREVFAAPPWINVSVQEVQLPDGRIIADYHHIEIASYAMIVAETAAGEIILERQYKHGVGQVSLMVPGGGIHPGEEPLEAAKRELYEETGYVAEQWRHLGAYTCDANYGCGHAHLFLAGGARRLAAPQSGDLEEMEIVLLTPEAALDALRNGEIPVLGAAAAIAIALAVMPRDKGRRNASVAG